MLDDIIRFIDECPTTSFGIFLILCILAGNLPFANIARRRENKHK